MSDQSPEKQNLPPKMDLSSKAGQSGPKVVIKQSAAAEPTKTIPRPAGIPASPESGPGAQAPQAPAQAASDASAVPASASGAQAPSKRDTSRIPLDKATSMAGELSSNGASKVGLAPRTIRIAPGTASTVRVQPPSAGLPSDEKRKTSRVSLESAVGPSPDTAGPKTIKLRRPAEIAGKVAPTVIRPVPASGPLSATAPIEMPGDAAAAGADDAATATQKKTIKVRRPVTRTAIRPVVQRGTEQSGISPEAIRVAAPVVVVARTGPFFPILAIAALLVMCVLVYLLSAEAFGPDFCLTQYSYAKGGPDLQWPGKMSFRPQ